MLVSLTREAGSNFFYAWFHQTIKELSQAVAPNLQGSGDVAAAWDDAINGPGQHAGASCTTVEATAARAIAYGTKV